MVVRVERTPGTRAKRVRRSMPEVLGVARAHFDEVAVVAGDVVDFEDFGQLRQRLGDAVLGSGLVAADGDEGEQPQAERLGIDLGGVAPERAAGFELANPFQHRRRRQADGPRNLYLRLAGVVLQELENLQVDVVERSVVLHNAVDYD